MLRMYLVTLTTAALVIAAISTVNAAAAGDHAPADQSPEADDDNRTLTIKFVSSTVSSITIRWTVPADDASTGNGSSANDDDDNSGRPTTLKVQAVSLATNITLTTPPIDAKEKSFTLPDLAVDSAYQVCVVYSAESACDTMRTIPTVRLDSVLALLLTIAFILLLILIAVICWRCAIFCASRAEASEQEPSIGDEKTCNASPTTAGAPGDDNVGDEKAPLLVPGGSPGGQSPNSDQQQPGSLYLYMTGPAVNLK